MLLLSLCFTACQPRSILRSEESAFSDFSDRYKKAAISTNNLVAVETIVKKEGNKIEYLIWALEANSLEVLDFLLRTDLQESSWMLSPYFFVRSPEAMLKLQQAGYSPNAVNHEGKSVARYYAEQENIEFLKYFCKIAEDLDLSSEKDLLFQVLSFGDVELLKCMQKRKADFTVPDSQGNYPIYYAKQDEVLSFLLDFPYDLKQQNQRKENVLGEVYLRLKKNGKKELAKRCLAKGVSSSYRSYQRK